jgi:hypothetical protein
MSSISPALWTFTPTRWVCRSRGGRTSSVTPRSIRLGRSSRWLASIPRRTTPRHWVGRHTGLGLAVDDLQASFEELSAKGVEFPMPPTKQPWGGTIAMFQDSEGNVSFLDQYDADHR